MRAHQFITAATLVCGLSVLGMARSAGSAAPSPGAASSRLPALGTIASETPVYLAVHPDLNDPPAARQRLVAGSIVLDKLLVVGEAGRGIGRDEVTARAFPHGAVEKLLARQAGSQTVLGLAVHEALSSVVHNAWTESGLPTAITTSPGLDPLFERPSSGSEAIAQTIITIDPEFQLFESVNDPTQRVLATVVWLRVFVVATPAGTATGDESRRFADLMYADRVESWVELYDGKPGSDPKSPRITEPEELIRKALDRALAKALPSLTRSPLLTRRDDKGTIAIDTRRRTSIESRSMTVKQHSAKPSEVDHVVTGQ